MSNCFVAPTVVVDLQVQYTFCATLKVLSKLLIYTGFQGCDKCPTVLLLTYINYTDLKAHAMVKTV